MDYWHSAQESNEALFILDLGNENACQEIGHVLNVVQCALLVRPPPRRILHMVASTWYTILTVGFRSNQEAPVVSEKVNTRSKGHMLMKLTCVPRYL